MTTTEVYTIIKTWINNILNSSFTSVGNCTFTNGTKTITGTGFITNGVIAIDGYIKRTSDGIDYYSQIASFTNTTITLYNNYLGTSGTGVAGSYTASFIPVIRGEQDGPKPCPNYITIHQPMSIKEYASGNFEKAQKINTGTEETPVYVGKVDYTLHYQTTISLEEIGFDDNGDKLRQLLGSLRLQDTKDYFRTNKISILRNEGIKPIPQLTENVWELKSNLDLIVLFPDENSYYPGLIENVEFSGTYN